MAFKMTPPIIKGSPMQKEAAAVVSQARTKADASLVGAADELGKSNIPGAMDYSIDNNIKIKQRKDTTKPKQYKDLDRYEASQNYTVDEEDLIQNEDGEWVPMEGAESNQYGDTWDAESGGWRDDGQSVEYDPDGNPTEDNQPYQAPVEPQEEEQEESTSEVFSGNPGDPYEYRRTANGGYEYKKEGGEWTEATTQEAIESIRERDPEFQESAIQQRNNRIYRNAVPNGKVRKKLMNQGFNPYKA